MGLRYRCLWPYEGTFFLANHNVVVLVNGLKQGVYDLTKVRFF